MLRIKICGITRQIDAEAAWKAGADAIGLIRVRQSPRYIDLETARLIASALPAFVVPVLVYADAPTDQILEEAVQVGCSVVQLHGAEPVEYLDRLRPLRVIKAITVQDETVYDAIAAWSEAGVSAILLDRPRGKGSGVVPPWRLLDPNKIRQWRRKPVPLILAGGLTPDNVAEAVERIRPDGVDVASGVEASAGIKEHHLINEFIRNARQAAGRDAASGK